MTVKLTEKQKSFIEYYIETAGNGTKAARLAGYAPSNCCHIAYLNLRKPGIKDEIQKRLKALEEERIADIREVKRYWTSVMRGAAIEMTMNSNGKLIEHEVCVNSRLRASEDLAKSHGLFSKKAEEPVKFNIIFQDDCSQEL